MIKEWLEEYKPANKEAAEQALREIMQEIALVGLQRSGFFEKAAFYGGTALRIFYHLDRFSEDLDFSLLEVDPDFLLEPYLEGMCKEFESLGIKVSVREKQKSVKTHVDSAFLKPDTEWKELILNSVIEQEGISVRPEIKIKIEVDKNPPKRFETEEKLLLKPYSFYTRCFTLPNLFAGKMHALLFRKWNNRIKGRDWYDMEWYVKKGVHLNLDHFLARAQDSGDWMASSISGEQFNLLLIEKIDKVSFKSIKEDVIRFIRDDRQLDLWSPTYFKELVEKLNFQ